MDQDNLWTAWPIAGPWRTFPLVGGTNSLIWGAEAANGQLFVLRIVPDIAQAPRLHYEAALLEALDRQGMPFSCVSESAPQTDRLPHHCSGSLDSTAALSLAASKRRSQLHFQSMPFLLPIPLKAKSGDSIVSFMQEDGTTALATLCPLLPGKLRDRDDRSISMTTSAASALAVLDRAFASLPETQTPANLLPTFGDLAHWHPLVPDPFTALERLPISTNQQRQIQNILATVLESVPDLYGRLPQQLLHRDYDSSNILMDGDRVTAVLDFEFASRDIRILDLCVSISWWPANLFGTGREWAVIDAFAQAYTHTYPLDEDELRALPAVWRIRDAASLVNRIGRYFAGQETETRIQNRIKHSLWRKEWLSANQDTLLQHALQW